MTYATELDWHRAVLEKAERQMARAGRWGTCVDCPVIEGEQRPERCRHAWRNDHQLGQDGIDRLRAWIDEQTRRRRATKDCTCAGTVVEDGYIAKDWDPSCALCGGSGYAPPQDISTRSQHGDEL